MTKIITFLSFILILFVSYSNLFGKDLKIIEERTFSISPGNNLKLDVTSGGVSITSWDKDQVYIKILGNEKAEEKIKFRFFNDDSKVELIAKRKGFFSWFSSGIKLHYEIKVPSKFNINVETGGGGIYTANISGDLNLSTSGGSIKFENVEGEFDVSTSGGSITGINFKGNLDASTSGGGLNFTGSDSKIKAETSGGSISLDYSGVNKGIYLSTSGGGIRIALPEDFNASAKLHTSGGGISCELTANNARKISHTEFIADLNKGGNPLYAETSGGSISVAKK
ncbi:MAG: DUF4097 family beta strand repeat-containing protein [Ignavibacteriaceae bacterium]